MLQPRLPAVLAALSLCTAPLAAQWSGCSPWSKWRLHEIPWTAGSTLELGSIAAGDAAIALRFSHDATSGVVLTSIGHRGSRKDGVTTVWEYQTDPPTGQPRSLWSATFRPVGEDADFELHPDADDDVRVWIDDPQDPHQAIFRWTDMDLCDPLCDSLFWMELCVHIDRGTPTEAVWNSRLGRIERRGPGCDAQYTLDEVAAPILHVRQPGDGTFARILVPIAQNTIVPAANLPMRLWDIVGYDLDLEHPARGQQMQFSAVFSNDPTQVPLGTDVLSSFRKLLYMSTEDSDGYYKRFQHRVVSDQGTLYYRWAPVYFPSYGFSPRFNFHRSEYPVRLAALEATTGSFYHDVTDRYRQFVEDDIRPTRIASNYYRLNPDFPRASVFQPSSVIPGVTPEAALSSVYTQTTDHALRLQEAFLGADGNATPTFMEWQKWLKGAQTEAETAFPARGAEDPIGPDFNPRPYSNAFESFQEPPAYALDEIDRAHAAGINASVYTLPLIMNDGDWPSFRDDWFLRTRTGDYFPQGPLATGKIIDHGNPFVAFWMVANLYDDIFDTAPKLGGVFFDVLSGGGSFLRYPADPSQLFRMKRYHGGASYVAGVRRLADLVRLRIAFSKQSCQHPDLPFLPGESVMEGIVGKLDFGQHGLKSLPMQQQFDALFDQLALVPTISVESSNPSPPLWNAVYHEWQHAEGLSVPLSTWAVSAALGGGQPFYPGVTWQRWGDYQRLCAALFWHQGMKPTIFPYYSDDDQNSLLVERNGNTEVRNPAIPQQGQLLAFLQRVHQSLDRDAEAGRFLVTGRMERPLQLGIGAAPAGILASLNPSFDIANSTDPGTPPVTSPLEFFKGQHFYENFFSRQPYNIPHVFHGVWRDVETGELGIVFVNWTDFPATWQGTLDPQCYEGLDDQFEVIGIRPDGAGVQDYAVGSGNGSTLLAWNPTAPGALPLQHHAAAAPGFMPARSVQVFVLRNAGCN